MRFTQLLLGIMTALLVAGCMAKTAVLLDKNAKEKVVAPASFYLSVVGKTLYEDADSKEKIAVGEIFQEEASKKLKEIGALAEDGDGKNHYVILVNILGYEPGNAAGRYFLGQLTNSFDAAIAINAQLCAAVKEDGGVKAGEIIALIPTGKALHKGLFGGIGGWKTIIVDAARDLSTTVEKTFLD